MHSGHLNVLNLILLHLLRECSILFYLSIQRATKIAHNYPKPPSAQPFGYLNSEHSTVTAVTSVNRMANQMNTSHANNYITDIICTRHFILHCEYNEHFPF